MDTIKSFSPKSTLWRVILAVTVLCTLLALVLQVNAQTESCIQSLDGNGTVNGTWDSTCVSENTPLGDYNYPSGTRYARFYTFTLSVPSTVTMELNSSADTYMYLMQGTDKTGNIEHYNDDIVVNENSDSRISESLSAGDYTIEATTYGVETSGNFTLTVSGLPGLPTTTPPATTPTTGTGGTPTVTPTPGGQVTPIPTPTSTPTHTPTQAPTTVPDNVINRLTAIETRVATQDGIISTLEGKVVALDGRVATLEAGALTPVPTPTPPHVQSTPTPAPTPTRVPPTAIPTPPPGNLGSRPNPIPLGQSFRPSSSPWELKVISVDTDAWPEIEAENQFNVPPAAGNRFVMVEIEVHYHGTSSERFSGESLSAVGTRAVEYTTFGNSCSVIPDSFPSHTRVFSGGRLQGNICFEVQTSDIASLLLFGDYFALDLTDRDYRNTLWFWSLRPTSEVASTPTPAPAQTETVVRSSGTYAACDITTQGAFGYPVTLRNSWINAEPCVFDNGARFKWMQYRPGASDTVTWSVSSSHRAFIGVLRSRGSVADDTYESEFLVGDVRTNPSITFNPSLGNPRWTYNISVSRDDGTSGSFTLSGSRGASSPNSLSEFTPLEDGDAPARIMELRQRLQEAGR